jgi:hypothetical protein
VKIYAQVLDKQDRRRDGEAFDVLMTGAVPSEARVEQEPSSRRWQALSQWAIQDSNLGPLPYQRSALTD